MIPFSDNAEDCRIFSAIVALLRGCVVVFQEGGANVMET
jgi:hypothetical protein